MCFIELMYFVLFFNSSNFECYLMNALVYVNIDQGIYNGKMKVAQNEKRKKLCGFSFSINIPNFEAFFSVFNLTKNLFFLKSVSNYLYGCPVDVNAISSSFIYGILQNIFAFWEKIVFKLNCWVKQNYIFGFMYSH